jgi:hypothetical protein
MRAIFYFTHVQILRIGGNRLHCTQKTKAGKEWQLTATIAATITAASGSRKKMP